MAKLSKFLTQQTDQVERTLQVTVEYNDVDGVERIVSITADEHKISKGLNSLTVYRSALSVSIDLTELITHHFPDIIDKIHLMDWREEYHNYLINIREAV